MVRSDKVELVERVSQQLKRSQSVILANYQGMTVEEMTGLRSKLRAEGIEARVIKNRLIRRALAAAGSDALDDLLHGNTIVAFGIQEASAPAKVLVEFSKANNKLVLKGGLLEGKRLDSQGVKSLASMPSRNELFSMVARDLKQPATKVALAVKASYAKVAYALGAWVRKREEAGEQA